jgi:hypothetical protein
VCPRASCALAPLEMPLSRESPPMPVVAPCERVHRAYTCSEGALCAENGPLTEDAKGAAKERGLAPWHPLAWV